MTTHRGVPETAAARRKAKSQARAEQTKRLRERLEPLVADLGGWASVKATELGDVADHVAKAKGLVGWPPGRGRHASARALKKGEALPERTWPFWQSFVDELEGAVSTEERYLALLAEVRGLPPEGREHEPAPALARPRRAPEDGRVRAEAESLPEGRQGIEVASGTAPTAEAVAGSRLHTDRPPSPLADLVAKAKRLAGRPPGEGRRVLYTLTMLAAFLTRALQVARRSFERLTNWVVGRFPSALARPLIRLGLLAAVFAAAVVLLPWNYTTSFLYPVYIGVSLLLSAVAWTTLVWMLHAWRGPDSLAETRLERDDLEPRHSFSLIVPARHEETVLEQTLSRLVTSDHPAFEVLVVVGHDDFWTRQVAERVAARYPELVKVVVDASWPKNKPKALNAALPHCTGSITGVFDAEDVVHPALLHRVDQRFQRTGADVVQAGVQLMNFRSSWFAVRNVLEYYFWFRSRLHFQARQGFIPLGGNTVFVRTRVLRAAGGWDPDCLAEDCELGVRLSALGARTVVVYEPELVTREETPPTLGAFARQRGRWNQGFLQTFVKGHWRRLPLRQRALGGYTLAMPYLMALAWLLIPVAIGTAVAVKAPVPFTLISFLPALPLLSILAVEVAGLNDFCRAYGERASTRDYARLVLGLLPYQAVLAFAAARAVAREARGIRGWEKTAHLGLHLTGRSDDDADGRPGGWLHIPSRRARKSEQAGVGSGALEPRTIGPTLPEGLVSRNRIDAYAEALSSGPVVAYAEEAHLSDVKELLSDQAGWAGNGQADGQLRRNDELAAALGRQALWVRLDSLSTNGSTSLSLPSIRPALVRAEGDRLRGVRTRLRTLVRSCTDLALLLPLLAGVGLLQATNMLHWPAGQFDEGTYIGNAWAVQTRGVLAPYTYSYGHPPLGWISISLWTWVSGIFGHATYSVDGGREFMLAVSVVSCSLLYLLARRLGMSRAFAAGAVMLFALSPLSLFFHRAVLLDNPATAWTLAAFVLALTPKRRLWTFAGSGACFAASVLSKETTLVILPALLLAAAQNADRCTRRYCLTLFVSFFTLIGLAYPLYATLKGELVPGRGHVSLIGYTITQLFTRKGTGNVLDPHSLAHGIVTFWLHLDPWLLGAALLLSPIALARRNTRAIALAYLIQAAMILRPGYLPSMYVIGLLPFAALIVAGSAAALWRFATANRPRLHLPAGQGRRPAILSRASFSWTRVAIAASTLVIVASFPVVALAVAPHWAKADSAATTTRLDGPQRAAEHWLVHNVGRQRRLIVPDEFWIYLIEHGFDAKPVRGGFYSRTVVDYWPLDYDPAVKRYFARGWRDFNYIVSTEAIRDSAPVDVPTTAQALQHSRVVARFGQGTQRIEIREITRAHP